MPLPLWEHIYAIEGSVRAAKRIWIGMDFDGTLTPIVDTPDRAVLAPEIRQALKRLIADPKIRIAIISGRALHDVKARVALEGIAYAGNHGLEIETPDFLRHEIAGDKLHHDLVTIVSGLEEWARKVPGVLVESKGLSLSVHYRLAPEDQWEFVESAVRRTTDGFPAFEVRAGSRVWEVRPAVAFDKGTAVAFLRERQCGDASLPIYFGDDVTDEDAFAAIKDGVTVLVGADRPSSADYRVESPSDVHRFLIWLGSH